MEDVAFMRERSIKQNYVFLVDSKERDRALWPTPSQYVVNFALPFQNVVGLEVLDATVPRTMYNVDSFNNTLRFFVHTDNYFTAPVALASVPWATATVPPGDYTIQTLVPALNDALSMRLNGAAGGLVAAVAASAVSTPPELLGKLEFTCAYPFVFDMNGSTMAETLGFDLYADATQGSKYTTMQFMEIIESEAVDASAPRFTPDKRSQYLTKDLPTIVTFTPKSLTNPRVFASVDKAPAVALGPTTTLFEGPRGVLFARTFTSAAWVAQRFDVAVHGFLQGMSVALTPLEGDDQQVEWALFNDNAGAPDTRTPLFTDAAGAPKWYAIGIDAADGSLSDATVPPLFQLLGGQQYWVVLRQNAGDARNVGVYYNDVASANVSTFKELVGSSWLPIDSNGLYYNMSVTVTQAQEYHRVEAPGLYSLVGERYATLRCPEIESASLRSLAYTTGNMGLGKIRLGVIGFSENRMDYNRVAMREFHPIGKLPRVTLRFEAGNGQLYDFKGVNHTVVMVVHYYHGFVGSAFGTSDLNPNYRPNFVEYLAHQEEQEPDSDEQSIDYNEDVEQFADWRVRQMRNTPEQRRLQDIEILRELDLEADRDLKINDP
jgi:hypothetical protein